MLIPCDEVNILNTFRVMIILRLLLLLTNLHLKLLSTQGTGADKLLSTQRVKNGSFRENDKYHYNHVKVCSALHLEQQLLHAIKNRHSSRPTYV